MHQSSVVTMEVTPCQFSAKLLRKPRGSCSYAPRRPKLPSKDLAPPLERPRGEATERGCGKWERPRDPNHPAFLLTQWLNVAIQVATKKISRGGARLTLVPLPNPWFLRLRPPSLGMVWYAAVGNQNK